MNGKNISMSGDYPFKGKTGYFAGVSAETYYLEMKQCSQSWLKYFNPNPSKGNTPANFFDEYLNPDAVRKFTDPLRFGQAFHLCILEPEEFERRVELWSETKTTNSKGFERADAAMEEGKILIPESWKEVLDGSLNALLQNKDTRAMLEIEADNELTLVWVDEETGVDCKCRLDRYSHENLLPIDFKSTRDASQDGFSKSVREYGYHVQAAYYSSGIKAVFGEQPRGFAFPLVEKDAPFLTNLIMLDDESIAAGDYIYRRNLRRYADCMERSSFPGYGDGVKVVGLPKWYLDKLEKDED